jgi:hypothetical protein
MELGVNSRQRRKAKRILARVWAGADTFMPYFAESQRVLYNTLVETGRAVQRVSCVGRIEDKPGDFSTARALRYNIVQRRKSICF